MGGGEIVDLWHGVEFGYRSPSWDIAPGLLRIKCLHSPLSEPRRSAHLVPQPEHPVLHSGA
jgi:hypothetical protein